MAKYLTILITLFTLFSSSFAQTSGSLGGIVTDSSRSPLPDVNVKIKGSYLGISTDIEGKYLIKGISPGEYTVQVSAIGYKTVEYTGIKISKGETAELNITLNITSYSIEEEILVIGDRPLLDIEQTESKHVISSDEIREKMVENVVDVVTLQPGVIKQDDALYIRGGRSDDNSFLLDGVSVQDPLSGTGFGLQLSSNVLEEVEVITGGYNAEYGQATSGVVNVKTKEGSYSNYSFGISYKKDNLGFNENWKSTFNTDVFEWNLSGPEPITKYLLKNLMKIKFPGEITLFGNFFMNISDGFQSVNGLYDDATRLALEEFIGSENFEERTDYIHGVIDKPVLEYLLRRHGERP